MQKILIEFIDTEVEETLKEFHRIFKIDRIYYSSSLSSEEEISNLFKANSLVYCEENDGYIFFYNTNQEIYFFVEHKVSLDGEYMKFFFEDFIDNFRFSFFIQDDEIFFRFLKGSYLNIQWKFNSNNILIEEDTITPEIFNLFCQNVFDILLITMTITEEFSRKNHLEAYIIDDSESIEENSKHTNKNYIEEKIQLSNYQNLLLSKIAETTGRQGILEKSEKYRFLLSLPLQD